MRLLAESYPEEEFVQQLVAQIPWGHNILILDKVRGDDRKWHINKTIENSWSRNVLALQIESGLIHRQGKAVTNFSQTLPTPQGDIARELLKDPYNFTFLTFDEETLERDLERGLLANLKKFLLELGTGFAFVGSQYHLEVSGEDFYIDLLFYHLRLRCFVVIDLKITEFKPEYAGKMNFYLSADDDLLRHSTDEPSIGVILCRDKNRVIAEYTLRDNNKPIGVSEYRVTKALPNELQGVFPTVEQLQAKLAAITVDEPDS